MSLNLTHELSKLIGFLSEVSTTIRMNSSFNKASIDHFDTPSAVMSLSDMMHNLWQISVVTDLKTYFNNVCKQIAYWKEHESAIEEARRLNDTFDRWTVQEGIDILTRIKMIVQTQLATHKSV